MAAAAIRRPFVINDRALARLALLLPLAAGATLALFVFMHALIRVDATRVEEAEPPPQIVISEYVPVSPKPDRTLPEPPEARIPPDRPTLHIDDTGAAPGAGPSVVLPVEFDPPMITQAAIARGVVPTFTVRPAPTYPAAELRRGVEGVCTVRYDILADGRTANIDILACDSAGFARATEQAVRQWRHAVTPGLAPGAVAVSGHTAQLDFTLQE